MQRLTFDSKHFVSVLDGSKRITMRFHDPVSVGPAMLVFEFPIERVLPGRILSTKNQKVSEVSDQDAIADGFVDASEVLSGLREYYPELELADEIVLVRFDVD